MLKRDELTNPASCMSRARDDEMTFVLLGRDAAAPAAIRAWIEERIRLGKNKRDDAQIEEAEKCIALMRAQNGRIVTLPDVPRCEKCHWPLAKSVAEGCVPGNCSMREN